MRTLALLAAIAALTVTANVKPAEAQRVLCKDRTEIIKILSRRFNETQRSYGLQNDRRVLELYASPDGSWTALVTLPSGKSCVIAAGEAWTTVPVKPAGEPA
jgi:hypothetical protein